jgi:transcription initiation factor TFIIIB Brf1 subunit/transcription initiation factor TFIIB
MSACEECGGGPILLDSRRGEAVCSNCSLVISETTFDFQEPRSEESREATTLNAGFPQTRMFNDSRDAGGAFINEESRSRIRRLAWLSEHSSSNRDRSVKKLYAAVNDACRKLQLANQFRDRVFYLSKRAYEKGVLRNQEFSLIVGAAIRLAAQESKVYLSDDAILKVLIISRERPKKQLQRAYRVVKRELALTALHTTPQMLLPKVSETLSLPVNVVRETRKMLDEFVVIHRPEVALAGAIFAASRKVGYDIKQTKIASASGTSDVSLRACVKRMWPDVLQGGNP